MRLIKMARKWIIAVVLMGLIVGGLFFMGFIPPADDNSASMEIIFYDADGNELGRSNDILGIQSPDFVGNIDTLDIVVYFQVTTDIDYHLISTKCFLTVETRLNTMTGSIVHTVAEHQLGVNNVDESGTFYATYSMTTLLPANKIDSTGKTYGWTMCFDAVVKTTVLEGSETVSTIDDTCGTTLTLVWEDGLTLESWFGDW
jgi:hypothetical protein